MSFFFRTRCYIVAYLPSIMVKPYS